MTPISTVPGIRIGVVDDDPDYLKQFVEALLQSPGFRCTHRLSNLTQLEATLAKSTEARDRPDVLILDLNFGKRQADLMIPEILKSWPTTRVVVWSVVEDTDRIVNAIRLGASGYLLKQDPIPRILERLRDSDDQGLHLSSLVARKVVNLLMQGSPAPSSGLLTPRQFEVLRLLAKGLMRKEIADELGISIKTVDSHTVAMYKTLHVNSSAMAVHESGFTARRPDASNRE